jgi:large subunit ribosomal protein L6e
VNGVPLRRVNPAFVIATSTKLCNVGIETYDLNDTYFNKIKTKKTQKPKESEDVFMSQVGFYIKKV